MGAGSGVTSLVSRRFGEGRIGEANNIAGNAVILRLSVWALRLKVCTIFLVEPQMMGVFTFQGMGMGVRALVLTMSRIGRPGRRR